MLLPVNHFYRFGKFAVDADQKVLFHEDQPLRVTPKVFDTLLILLESHHRIVEKEELMRRLWPDVFVEETNLTFNIQQLRKALGDSAQQPIYIETVPRRGYRFIATVQEGLAGAGLPPGSQTRAPREAVLVPQNASDAQPEPAAAPTASVFPRHMFARQVMGKGLVLILVLTLAGLLVWRFSPSLANVLSYRTSLTNSPKPGANLKFEKLTGTGESRLAALSTDGKYLAYTRRLKDTSSIWLRQLVTNTNIEIVPAGSLIYGLAFAHSSAYLYFVRSEPRALQRVSLLGGAPSKIVETLEGDFAISADDRQIAFIRTNINHGGQLEYALLLASLESGGERLLLKSPYPYVLDVPVWSPAGDAILCSYGSSTAASQTVSLIEVSVADGVKKELSPERFFHINKMSWLPDKSGLLMSARKNLAHPNQLWQVSYPGMQIHQFTADVNDYLDLSIATQAGTIAATQSTRICDIWVGSNGETRNLKKIAPAIDTLNWTPDGRLIYTSTASGNKNLWIMQPDGTQQRQLTNDPVVDTQPAVTADNRYIVFHSNRTGAAQIWRMELDGSNPLPLTHGTANVNPSLTPDGKWVLFNTPDNWHLWKVSIDGGEPVRLTDFIAARPAVSPDGKTIACIGRTGTKRELLLLPLEGGPPRKRFDVVSQTPRLQWTSDGQFVMYLAERNGEALLVKQGLRGGLPQTLLNLGENNLFDFSYAADGKALAVTRGNWQHDIVLLHNQQQ
jgi:DNA-binding winged helix-turn-helix (wHTH) protein/Tol biopolymer transport system component